jgi:murein L,D-transpeptidase YafK
MDKYYMRSKPAVGKLFVIAGRFLIMSLIVSLIANLATAEPSSTKASSTNPTSTTPSSTRHGKATSPETRIEVNVSEMSLTVWAGNKALRHYPNIAIGSGGVSSVHYQGDESTPLGEYTVLWVNRDSAFDIFVGLNYPTQQHAEKAFEAGRISIEEYRRIAIATRYHSRPPFNTALGGRIGIHGIGRGSREIHQAINWTNGCVALTNEEMRDLMRWIHVGTKVAIRR